MTIEDEEGFSTQPLLPPTCYVPPITRDHDSDAGASSNSTSLPRHSCVTENSNPEMSGEGVELHPRNSYLWTFREVRWLKPTLSSGNSRSSHPIRLQRCSLRLNCNNNMNGNHNYQNHIRFVFQHMGHVPGLHPPSTSFSRVMVFLLRIISSRKKL